MLQEPERHQRHERMPMQPLPTAALEMVQAEFFLELLMRLLADPPCLDGAGERPERRVSR